MKIKLKPNWSLAIKDGIPSLTSEGHHYTMKPEQADTLQLLRAGVSPEDLSDEQFAQVETLNDQGFTTISSSPDLAAWELHDIGFKHVQEQIKHVTVNVLDCCRKDHSAADYLREQLEKAGFKQPQDPKIILVVAEAFTDLPDLPVPALPLIVNRMRPSVGPLILPWREPHIRDQVASSPHYLREISYSLPEHFDNLQKAWVATTAIQFLVTNRQRFVNHIVELNMYAQEVVQWPIQS